MLNRPLWDDILRGEYWHLAHAMATSVEGWLILILNRHAEAVSDLTPAEARELGHAIRDVSCALQSVLGVPKTYVAQFAEHPDYPHVHVHVIPRHRDLARDHIGPGVFALLNAPETGWVPETRKNAIAMALRDRMLAEPGSVSWSAVMSA